MHFACELIMIITCLSITGPDVLRVLNDSSMHAFTIQYSVNYMYLYTISYIIVLLKQDKLLSCSVYRSTSVLTGHGQMVFHPIRPHQMLYQNPKKERSKIINQYTRGAGVKQDTCMYIWQRVEIGMQDYTIGRT